MNWLLHMQRKRRKEKRGRWAEIDLLGLRMNAISSSCRYTFPDPHTPRIVPSICWVFNARKFCLQSALPPSAFRPTQFEPTCNPRHAQYVLPAWSRFIKVQSSSQTSSWPQGTPGPRLRQHLAFQSSASLRENSKLEIGEASVVEDYTPADCYEFQGERGWRGCYLSMSKPLFENFLPSLSMGEPHSYLLRYHIKSIPLLPLLTPAPSLRQQSARRCDACVLRPALTILGSKRPG